MPDDERTTPQVRKVYELLVKTHPQYHNFREEEDWAFAQKKTDEGAGGEREIVVEKVVEIQKQYLGVGWFLNNCAKAIFGRRSSKTTGKA